MWTQTPGREIGRQALKGAQPSLALSRFWSRALEDSPQLAFALDTEGRILAVNEALVTRLGSGCAEMLGESCPRAVRGACTEFCPFSSISLRISCHVAEVHCAALDGDFSVTVTPFPDANGEMAGCVCIVADLVERRRIEEALHECETRQREILQHAPIAIFRTTLEGKAIYLSPAFASLLGYESSDELMEVVNASTIQDVLWAEPAARQRIVEQVRNLDGWHVVENIYRRRDGGKVEAMVYLSQRHDPVSERPYLHGFIQDVTAERESRRVLERTAALLEEAVELTHLGSWEWDVASGICRFSDEGQRMRGLERAEMTFDEVIRLCHPDDLPALLREFETVRAGRGPCHLEYRTIRADTGEVRHVEVFGRPVRGADGLVERVVGASLDVTDRVRAREALEERERRLQVALRDAVAALGATVQVRDPYTAGHQERVADIACRIAGRLGWDGVEIETLRIAALVHDIGKIGIPAEILSKPARLTDAEFDLVKSHSRASYEILAPIAFEGPVATIVLQHHERLDGSGYPDGLSGEAVLPAARVLAVADTLEAMVSHRPYRPALPLAVAVEELSAGSGVRYDSEVVTACLRMLDGDPLAPVSASV